MLYAHEYAQTAVDVLSRRTRLAFLNAQAALEALPMVIDSYERGAELEYDKKKSRMEGDCAVPGFHGAWQKSKLNVSRGDVLSGRAGEYDEHERKIVTQDMVNHCPCLRDGGYRC